MLQEFNGEFREINIHNAAMPDMAGGGGHDHNPKKSYSRKDFCREFDGYSEGHPDNHFLTIYQLYSEAAAVHISTDVLRIRGGGLILQNRIVQNGVPDSQLLHCPDLELIEETYTDDDGEERTGYVVARRDVNRTSVSGRTAETLNRMADRMGRTPEQVLNEALDFYDAFTGGDYAE